MDLREAMEQYVDMLVLGGQALRRIVERELDEVRRAELSDLIEEIVVQGKRLQRFALSYQHGSSERLN